jgi:zinc transport system permease protein
MDPFLIRAALAGLGVAVAAGPLGAFIVWRRMAYFGDATAHAAILGVAIALALEAPVGLGTLAVALGMGLIVSRMMARGQTADATLGVLAHGALAVGLLAFSIWGGVSMPK